MADDTKPSDESTPASQTAAPQKQKFLTRRAWGFSDPSDTYANQKNLFITIEYPAINKKVTFKGFLTEFSDSFTANWNEEQLLQRNDMIATYKNTTRAINLGWSVPAASLAEAQRNLEETSSLMKMLYGLYTPLGNGVPGMLVLNQPPLLKVRFSNLVQERPGVGLYIVVSGFTFSPDLEAGFFDPDQQLYPKSWDLSLEGNVLHQQELGWKTGGSWRGNSNFPYLPAGPVTADVAPKATFAGVKAAAALAREQEQQKPTAAQEANLEEASKEEEDQMTLIDQVSARFNKIMGAG